MTDAAHPVMAVRRPPRTGRTRSVPKGPRRFWAAVALALAACGSPPPRGAGPGYAPDPEAEGPFPVGVTTVELLDQDRATNGEPRRIRTEVWYPAAPEARAMPRDVVRWESEAPAEYRDRVARFGLAIEQDAARDAPPERRVGRFPLVVFSHGAFGIRHQSVFATRHWASHGYVVAAPDHAGNTLWDALQGAGAGSLAASSVDRPIDVVLLWRALIRGVIAAEIAAVTDTRRFAVSGHSFGGNTAAVVAGRIPGVAVAMPLAPALTLLELAGVDLSQLSTAFAIFGATDDRTTPYEREQVTPYGRVIAVPRMLVGLRGGGHFTFTDACGLPLADLAREFQVDVGNVFNDGCGPQFLAIDRAHALVRRYSTAWLAWRLRDSDVARATISDAAPAEVDLRTAL